MPGEITLAVDGVQISAKPGQTVIQAAMDAGLYIPYLCYWPGMKPFGACRMCVVEVEGQRGAPASCTTPVAEGMVVKTGTPLVKALRKGVMELLLSEHPHGCLTCHRIELCGPSDICLRHVRVTDRCVICPKNERCELKDTVRYLQMEMETPLTYNYRNLPIEVKDPFYDRDYNLCIVCGRCVRACEELRGDDAICFVERSGTALVGTSRGTSLLESGCEFCGACIDVCPVGALVERDWKWEKAARTVVSTCTHCPVGCQVKLEVDKRGRVIRSTGDYTAPVNQGQLCFKGKFGMEFVNHKARLTRPMVRRNGHLAEASWEEALGLVAQRLRQYKGDQFALLVSPRATNEEMYLAQKFARVAMGTNNVDVSSNTRPELVLGLREGLGFMAASGSFWELEEARCALVVNSNTTEEHNVVAVPLKRGQRSGKLKLIVLDTREVELTRYADLWLRPYPGTEVILLGGILRAILDAGLEDREFLAAQCEGLEALKAALAAVNLDYVAQTTGVEQEKVQKAAQLFAGSRPGAALYALDNIPPEQRDPLVRALVALVLLTGNVGKPSSGIFPLRNGTNEQGAYDMGCVPFLLPGYVSLRDEGGRKRFEEAWRTQLPAKPGLGVREVFSAVRRGEVRAMQVVGDSPSFDDAALEALKSLDFLVVHEHFLSPLAQRAHVVLPSATFAEKEGTYTNLERRVQLARQALEPKGETRPDWWVFVALAQLLGARGLGYAGPAQVLDEAGTLVPFYRGISYGRLQGAGLFWPCLGPDHAGTPRLGPGAFNGRKGHLLPFQGVVSPTQTTQEFPLLLAPGRVLAQPEGEIEVVRGSGLNRIRRTQVVQLHPKDAASLGIAQGEAVELVTAGGRLPAVAHLSGPLKGVVALTRLFGELATDLEASEAHDPMLRVPGLEVVPVRVEKAARPGAAP